MKHSRFLAIMICGLASLFYVYDYFIQVSPAIITHQLMRDFTIGAEGLGVLGSCFFYTYAGMQIPAGVLLDKFGSRTLLTFAVLISGVGVLLFGLTSHFTVACISRLLVGFGSAFSFVGTLFLVSRWFPHRHFAMIAGCVQLAGCLGSVFGEAPLAAVMNRYGWRPTMIWIGIFTFVLSLLFWLIIRDRKNLPGATFEKQYYNLESLKNVFKNSQVLSLATLGFVCWIPVATLGALWGVPYLMEVFHITNTHAAGYVSLFWISLGISSPLLGSLSDKLMRRKPIFYFCFAIGIIGALLLILAPQVGAVGVVLGVILLGILPAIQSLTFAAAKDFLPADVFGAASGLINMAPIVGGALAQMFIGFILKHLWDGTMSHGVPVYDVVTYQKGMSVLLVAAVVGLLLSHIWLKESYQKTVTRVATKEETI